MKKLTFFFFSFSKLCSWDRNIRTLHYKDTKRTPILSKYLPKNLVVNQIIADSENWHNLSSNNILGIYTKNFSWKDNF